MKHIHLKTEQGLKTQH